MRGPKLLLGFTEDDLLIMHRSDGSGGGKLPDQDDKALPDLCEPMMAPALSGETDGT